MAKKIFLVLLVLLLGGILSFISSFLVIFFSVSMLGIEDTGFLKLQQYVVSAIGVIISLVIIYKILQRPTLPSDIAT